jgi:iron complex transport system substrate-binding protein
MPELIETAGGQNLFGTAGEHSASLPWSKLVAADPEVIIVAPCGFGLTRCLEELPLLAIKPCWAEIDAVRNGRVYFADGNAYFNRPGPRLAESGEMLAEIIHAELGARRYEGFAWVRHRG